MLSRRIGTVLAAIPIVLVTLGFAPTAAKQTAMTRVERVERVAKPWVRVNGETEPITEGEVIQQGTKEGNHCHYDEKNTVGFSLPDDMGAVAYEIELTQDSDCDLVVESAGAITPPTEEAPTVTRRGGAVSHRMWAFHTVFEYVNITVTEERVKLTYDRDGGQVFNGRDKDRQSYTDELPWYTNHQAQNSDLNGPNEVFYYSRTRYWSNVPPTPDYALSARTTANPGPSHSCSFSQGNLPWGWDRKCTGGLFY